MSYAYNLLADPAFVSSLRQDNSSWTNNWGSWTSAIVEPVVESGGGFTASGSYPEVGTVTVDQMPRTAVIGDIFVFSGGSTLTLTVAIAETSDTSQDVTGTVSGIYNQQSSTWGGIAVGEKIIEHKTHLPRFTKYPSDSIVQREGRIDLVANTSYDATKHNFYGGGIAYAWGNTFNKAMGNATIYNTSIVTKLMTNDSRNGSSQTISDASEDIRNVMTPDVNTTILQMRNFGGAVDKGEHEHDPERKGGYWWVEFYLLDTNNVAKQGAASPYFFLEIVG